MTSTRVRGARHRNNKAQRSAARRFRFITAAVRYDWIRTFDRPRRTARLNSCCVFSTPCTPSTRHRCRTYFSYVASSHRSRFRRALNGDVLSKTSYTYCKYGKVLSETEAASLPEERSTVTEYDDVGRTLNVYSDVPDLRWVKGNWRGTKRGNVTHYNYITGTDRVSSVTQKAGWAASSPATIASYTYAADGKRKTVADALGYQTSYIYDKMGRPDNVTNALGDVTHYDHDYQGRLLVTTQYDDNTLMAKTEKKYDPMGRVYQDVVYNVDNETNTITTNYYHNPVGNPVKVTDPNGHSRWSVYDAAGRRTTDNDALGNCAYYTYDPASRATIVESKQKLSDTPTYRRELTINYFDKLRRAAASVFWGINTPSGWSWNTEPVPWNFDNIPVSAGESDDNHLVTSYAYGCDSTLGAYASVTDPKGIETVNYADRLGRTTRTVESIDGIDRGTLYQYDESSGSYYQDTITAKNEPYGDQVTKYVRGDPQDATRVTETIYPDTGSVVVTYNANGAVTTRTDQRKWQTTHTRDALGRVTREEVAALDGANPFSVVGTKLVTRTYDALGRVTQLTDSNGKELDNHSTVTYCYQWHNDSSDLTVTEKEYDNNVLVGQVTSVINGAGERTKLTYPNGRVIDFAYDNVDRLDTITESGTTLADYDYKGYYLDVRKLNGDALRLTSDNGTVLGGYDPFGRTIWMRHHKVSSGDNAVVLAYGHDYASNPLYQEDQKNAASDELYSYDALHRLVTFKRGDLTAAKTAIDNITREQAWTLDKLGNWVGFSDNGVTHESQFNYANENQVPCTGDGYAHTVDGESRWVTHDAGGGQCLFENRRRQFAASGRPFPRVALPGPFAVEAVAVARGRLVERLRDDPSSEIVCLRLLSLLCGEPEVFVVLHPPADLLHADGGEDSACADESPGIEEDALAIGLPALVHRVDPDVPRVLGPGPGAGVEPGIIPLGHVVEEEGVELVAPGDPGPGGEGEPVAVECFAALERFGPLVEADGISGGVSGGERGQVHVVARDIPHGDESGELVDEPGSGAAEMRVERDRGADAFVGLVDHLARFLDGGVTLRAGLVRDVDERVLEPPAFFVPVLRGLATGGVERRDVLVGESPVGADRPAAVALKVDGERKDVDRLLVVEGAPVEVFPEPSVEARPVDFEVRTGARVLGDGRGVMRGGDEAVRPREPVELLFASTQLVAFLPALATEGDAFLRGEVLPEAAVADPPPQVPLDRDGEIVDLERDRELGERLVRRRDGDAARVGAGFRVRRDRDVHPDPLGLLRGNVDRQAELRHVAGDQRVGIFSDAAAIRRRGARPRHLHVPLAEERDLSSGNRSRFSVEVRDMDVDCGDGFLSRADHHLEGDGLSPGAGELHRLSVPDRVRLGVIAEVDETENLSVGTHLDGVVEHEHPRLLTVEVLDCDHGQDACSESCASQKVPQSFHWPSFLTHAGYRFHPEMLPACGVRQGLTCWSVPREFGPSSFRQVSECVGAFYMHVAPIATPIMSLFAQGRRSLPSSTRAGTAQGPASRGVFDRAPARDGGVGPDCSRRCFFARVSQVTFGLHAAPA